MHDRVIDYVQARSSNNSIFCLPYPKTMPYVPEAELHLLEYQDLDSAYTNLIAQVRMFVSGVAPKAAVHSSHAMTGMQLAELVERLVPALNDVESAAKALVSMRAEAARSNATLHAEQALSFLNQGLADCSAHPQSLDDLTHLGVRAVEEATAVFDAHLLGDASMPENMRERSRLLDSLHWITQAAQQRMLALWTGCRPDAVFVIFRDYYLLIYALQIDVMVRALVEHKAQCPSGLFLLASSPSSLPAVSPGCFPSCTSWPRYLHTHTGGGWRMLQSEARSGSTRGAAVDRLGC